MATWRRTKSGFEFQVLKAKEITDRLPDGDYWTWNCGQKGCPVTVQGGRAALRDHYTICHPEASCLT